MLSKDEIKYGMTFILKLFDTAGKPTQWIELLCADSALHWYDIYRRSDWDALRREASDTFTHAVTEAEAESVRSARHRCIYIHTDAVKTHELTAAAASGAGA